MEADRSFQKSRKQATSLINKLKFSDHSSIDGQAITKIVKFEIAGDPVPIEELLGRSLKNVLGGKIEVNWLTPTNTEGESGFVVVHVMTPSIVLLDQSYKFPP